MKTIEKSRKQKEERILEVGIDYMFSFHAPARIALVFFFLLSSFFFIFPAHPAHAGLQLASCTATGNCTIDDIVKQAVYFVDFLMGISGALFLLVFVYGGGLYVLSFGRQEWVKDGFDKMKKAAIGIILIMSAYTVVYTVASALGYKGVAGGGAASGTSTSKIDTCGTPMAKKGSTGWTCKVVTDATDKAKCVTGECMSNTSKDYVCCPAEVKGGALPADSNAQAGAGVTEKGGSLGGCGVAAGTEGRTCMDVTNEGKGKNCIGSFCSGGANRKCCK